MWYNNYRIKIKRKAVQNVTINDRYKNNLVEQLKYYNKDKTELLDEYGRLAPCRAISANIAWCLIDKDRFFQYYNKSNYWKALLVASLRFYIEKIYAIETRELGVMPESDIKTRDKLREYMMSIFDMDLLSQNNYSYTDLGNNLDIGTIDIMFVQQFNAEVFDI